MNRKTTVVHIMLSTSVVNRVDPFTTIWPNSSKMAEMIRHPIFHRLSINQHNCTKIELIESNGKKYGLFSSKLIFICPESWRTYIATVSKIIFLPYVMRLFLHVFDPQNLEIAGKFRVVCRLSSYVCCLSNVIKFRHQPCGHSFGLICIKFGTLVYLCDA